MSPENYYGVCVGQPAENCTCNCPHFHAWSSVAEQGENLDIDFLANQSCVEKDTKFNVNIQTIFTVSKGTGECE